MNIYFFDIPILYVSQRIQGNFNNFFKALAQQRFDRFVGDIYKAVIEILFQASIAFSVYNKGEG